MTTKVDIANKALGFLAVKRKIDTLENTTGDVEATTLAGHYREAKSITLSSLDWSFARKKRVVPELIETLEENGSKVYIWAYPRDFLSKPKVFRTDESGYRYEVSFRSFFHKERKVIETCIDRCDMDYIFDLPEKFYFPRLATLNAYKLAELARNEIVLGDGALTVDKLREQFERLLDEMGESEYQLNNTLHDTINTFEEARLEDTGPDDDFLAGAI